jgi:hypothetical protein
MSIRQSFFPPTRRGWFHVRMINKKYRSATSPESTPV